mmetsp:Transcript_28464/g.88548  ORF Transcript_28464/g.88548 Transcript_28464/m.88548 type:complete len:255 (-) Transcript_28464:24-788(-)
MPPPPERRVGTVGLLQGDGEVHQVRVALLSHPPPGGVQELDERAEELVKHEAGPFGRHAAELCEALQLHGAGLRGPRHGHDCLRAVEAEELGEHLRDVETTARERVAQAFRLHGKAPKGIRVPHGEVVQLIQRQAPCSDVRARRGGLEAQALPVLPRLGVREGLRGEGRAPGLAQLAVRLRARWVEGLVAVGLPQLPQGSPLLGRQGGCGPPVQRASELPHEVVAAGHATARGRPLCGLRAFANSHRASQCGRG